MRLADISFSTNGQLYALVDNAQNVTEPELALVNESTGALTTIHSFPDSVRFNGMTTRSDDVFFMLGRSGHLWTYNLITGEARSLGLTPYRSAGDLTFYKGELYYSNVNRDIEEVEIVRIDLDDVSARHVVISKRIPQYIAGITSIAEACDSLRIYGFGGADTVYHIDIESRQIRALHSYTLGANGGASTGEFFGSADPLEIDLIRSAPEICGRMDAQLAITTSGGSGSLSYSIDGGSVMSDDSEYTDLSAGEYHIVVSDSLGCTAQDTVIIPEISGPIIDSVSIRPATCGTENAEITIHSSSAASTTQYSIDDRDYQDSPLFVELDAGMRYVYVLGDMGCEDSILIDIPRVDGPVISAVELLSSSCDETFRSLIVSATGAGPLSYSSDRIAYQTSAQLDSLSIGEITVYVRDLWGCMDSMDVTLEPTPAPSIIELAVSPTSCNLENGRIVVSASGISSLNYRLEGASGQLDSVFVNLAEGPYTIIVTDSLGCTASEDIIIDSSSAVELRLLSQEDVRCGDQLGTAEVVATEGEAPYLYAIDDGDYQSDGGLSDLQAGDYQVLVLDAAGCIDSVEIQVDSLPHVRIDSVSVSSTICGESGGIARLYYESPSEVTALLDGQPIAPPYTFTALVAGSYEIVLSDAAGCSDSAQFAVESSEALTVPSLEVKHSTCQLPNARISFELSGLAIDKLQVNGELRPVSSVVEGLSAGEYVIELTDIQGCMWDTLLSVTTTDSLIVDDLLVIDPTDCSTADGSISVSLRGDPEVIDLLLNGRSVDTEDGISFTQLKEGDYDIAIIDTAGCMIQRLVLLDQQNCPIYIPNVFSPNADGVNDTWSIYTGSDIQSSYVSIQVYDRWGNLIYRNPNLLQGGTGWDGNYKNQPVPNGVYTYLVSLDGVYGEVTLSGDVTVIR